MRDIAIRTDGLSKQYRIGIRHNGYRTLRDTLTDAFAAPFRRARRLFRGQPYGAADMNETIWALKDVSFEIKRGEVVGVIGKNGAGKTTLLKILSRITEPTKGQAEIYGRVGSLLEVGTGFHPELTGRENIYLNGAILGMRKAEIEQKFDEIVDFAEIEKFIDTPVKHYSSGMYVRLAFAVAAHLEPEILLVDEVLAVGDAAFQRKCLGKIGDVVKEGRTVLFVSHNMGAIHSLTKSCIYLKSGRIEGHAKTQQIINQYLDDISEQRINARAEVDFYRRDIQSSSPARLTRIWVNDQTKAIPTLEMGADFSIFVEIEVREQLKRANLTVVLKDIQGRRAALFFSWDNDFSLSLEVGIHVVELGIDGLPLTPGHYFVDIGVNQSPNAAAYDVIQDLPLFEIAEKGKIIHWHDRPWGSVHWNKVCWKVVS